MTSPSIPYRDQQAGIPQIESLSEVVRQIRTATLGGTLAREMTRIEEQRSSWRKALIDTDLLGKQVRELAGNSVYSQMVKELKALQSPAISIAKQYENLLGSSSAIGSAYKVWQESERLQKERMRKIFDPMADIRKSVLGDTATQQLIKELTVGSSLGNHMKEITEQALGISSVAKILAQHVDDSRTQTKKLFEDLGVGSMQRYLKNFEHINKQWKVPNEVLGIVGSLKELQDQLGKVALPTIDWGSAAALAKALGPEGIQGQLALLGIEPDGSIHEHVDQPERGLLSRKQSDAIALMSLLLSILFFLYQEISSQQDKAQMDAFQTQTTTTLRVQTQQIQSLTVLIEKALIQAAQTPQERFVVRERTATVRSKPEHTSSVQGKLMPNEVVRAIEKDGKWVEVEYYHWLHEEYRTGWVLKKYLERVPANYAKAT
ncbi:MAG: SH3 domain-containing protein [Limnohabitans sp.]